MQHNTIPTSSWDLPLEAPPFVDRDLTFLQDLFNAIEAGEEFTPDIFTTMVTECETVTETGRIARLMGIGRNAFYSAARHSGQAQWSEACRSFFTTVPGSAGGQHLPVVRKDLSLSLRENLFTHDESPIEVWGVPTRAFLEQRNELLRLIDKVGEYHLVDDVGACCFALSVACSTDLDGSPLWGMIVGPPSGGKTEDLDLVDERVAEHLDDVTAPGLLSWHKPQGGGESERGGALVRIGERGLVTIADFSTVLSDAQRGRRDALFSMLRRVYDGDVQRDLGNEEQSLRWSGRITFLAACTGAIDNFASHSDALGPRWVYLRRLPRDRDTRRAVTRRSLSVSASHQGNKKAQAKQMAGALVQRGGSLAKQVRLTAEAIRQIEDAALVVCFGRASILRDSYGQREIVGMPEMEEPPRVAKQLLMLAKCLVAIGMTEQEAIALTSRVAIDSMPAMRAEVLDAVAGSAGKVTTADVARGLGLPWKVVNRVMEDFSALGLLTRSDTSSWDEVGGAAQAKPWTFDHEDADIIRAVLVRRRLVRKEPAG